MKKPRREVIIDPKTIQPVINGAAAWSFYLRQLSVNAKRLDLDIATEFEQKADDLIRSVTIVADAMGLTVPELDDPMNFGGNDGK